MNTDIRTIGIGMLAGAATVVLCLGVATGSGLLSALYFLSAVPLMTVALGWGTAAAVAGVLTSIGLIGASGGFQLALYITMTTIIPAAGAGYLLNLARPAEEIGGPRGQIVWYPLSDVIFRLALITGCAFIIVGMLVGYGPELIAEVAEESFKRLTEMNPDYVPSEEAKAGLTQFLTGMTAFLHPAFWLMLLIGNLYISLVLARMTGRLTRPREDWALSLRLPRLAAAVFGAAMIGSFIVGPVGLAATAVAGALAGGLVLSGLAVLHARTRGLAAQTPILVLAYIGLALFIGALPLLIIGLTSTARAMPVSPAGGPPANPPSST